MSSKYYIAEEVGSDGYPLTTPRTLKKQRASYGGIDSIPVELLDLDELIRNIRYGRLVADIKIGSRWINKELIEEGYAWHYKRYSKDLELAESELNAKKEAKGLWIAHNPVPPWEYRRK